ncbi:MAG: hypothetical protein Q9169_001791 [Polycauliona sp. 2 TL-2023]
MPSPFPLSTSHPGTGTVKLTLRSPDQPVFEVLSFSYPLKLVVSAPHNLPNAFPSLGSSIKTPTRPSSVPLLFLLTYGGGLVSGDQIHLSISLAPITRLTIATQGSTKIFKPSIPDGSSCTAPVTRQSLHVRIAANAGLWFGPDPCQPYASSRYAQAQIFEVDVKGGGSLGLVDWVSEGRSARGEKWKFEGWRGKNEIWDVSSSIVGEKVEGKQDKGKRMVLRDNLILSAPEIASRVDGLGIFGTILLIGPLFSSLAISFIDEFKALPRIGARDWNAHHNPNVSKASGGQVPTEQERRGKWRKQRQEREKKDGIVWTAAHVRGMVVVKFGARDVEGARVWLRDMLREEGTLEEEFGSGALTCVK